MEQLIHDSYFEHLPASYRKQLNLPRVPKDRREKTARHRMGLCLGLLCFIDLPGQYQGPITLHDAGFARVISLLRLAILATHMDAVLRFFCDIAVSSALNRFVRADHHCSFEIEAGLQKVAKDYTWRCSHFPVPINLDIWAFHGLFYGPARAARSHSFNIIRNRSQSQTRKWPRRPQSQPLQQALGFRKPTIKMLLELRGLFESARINITAITRILRT